MKTDMCLGKRIIEDYDEDRYVYYNGHIVYIIENNNYHDILLAATCGDMILVTEEFTTLPVVVQEVIVLHELGHIELGHTTRNETQIQYNLVRKLYSKLGKVMSIEKEADDYMVSHLGIDGALIGLNLLKEYTLKNFKGKVDIKELNRRIKRIERKDSIFRRAMDIINNYKAQ